MIRKAVVLFLFCASSPVVAYKNIYGEPLHDCSSNGMALTGYTRTGQCVDRYDDRGSHHICIDLGSMNDSGGGNFCQVTGQPDWCSTKMPCVESSQKLCPVRNWCVCQWAFASYVERAGGCENIQDIVCEAINMEAYISYKAIVENESFTDDNSRYKTALECIQDRCDHARIEQGFSQI